LIAPALSIPLAGSHATWREKGTFQQRALLWNAGPSATPASEQIRDLNLCSGQLLYGNMLRAGITANTPY
jgi:hypothetical protein